MVPTDYWDILIDYRLSRLRGNGNIGTLGNSSQVITGFNLDWT